MPWIIWLIGAIGVASALCGVVDLIVQTKIIDAEERTYRQDPPL